MAVTKNPFYLFILKCVKHTCRESWTRCRRIVEQRKKKKETMELRCLFLKNKTHGTVKTKQNRRKSLFIESVHNLLIILKLLWSYLLKRSCKNYPVCRHLQKTERVPDLFPTEWRNKKFLLKKKKPGFPKYSRRFPFDYYSRKRPALITSTFEKLRLKWTL